MHQLQPDRSRQTAIAPAIHPHRKVLSIPAAPAWFPDHVANFHRAESGSPTSGLRRDVVASGQPRWRRTCTVSHIFTRAAGLRESPLLGALTSRNCFSPLHPRFLRRLGYPRRHSRGHSSHGTHTIQQLNDIGQFTKTGRDMVKVSHTTRRPGWHGIWNLVVSDEG